jgi:putative two-component system response regulator
MPAMSQPPTAKILVVDDEDAIREYLQQILTEWGYTVITAADGREALPVAVREQPDLILLDIAMPHLDGIETCKRLRERPTTRAARVIILTAYDTRDRLEESIAAGADDFLGKPINLTELRLRVTSMLKVKDTADAVERLEAYIRSLKELRARDAAS